MLNSRSFFNPSSPWFVIVQTTTYNICSCMRHTCNELILFLPRYNSSSCCSCDRPSMVYKYNLNNTTASFGHTRMRLPPNSNIFRWCSADRFSICEILFCTKNRDCNWSKWSTFSICRIKLNDRSRILAKQTSLRRSVYEITWAVSAGPNVRFWSVDCHRNQLRRAPLKQFEVAPVTAQGFDACQGATLSDVTQTHQLLNVILWAA